MPEELLLPFLKKEQVAKDTYSFYFDRRDVHFDFLAGQYIRLTLSIDVPDDRGSSRLFSVASSPLEKEYIMITTKVLDSAFKKTLVCLASGVKVKIFGPIGRFVIDEGVQQPYVFLAGGIGITPFHSILTYSALKKLSVPIALFASFSTLEEMIFYQELTDVARKNPSIKVIYTLTQPERSIAWSGETGRISEALIKKYSIDFINSSYYIAGPPKMVTAMDELAKSMGIEDSKIRKENFIGY